MPIEIKQPHAIPLNDHGEWILIEDYELDGFKIPKGFIFDGASIPRIMWSIMNFTPIGYHMPAALVHDYLYRNVGIAQRYDKPYYYTKPDADKEFHRILRELGIRSWQASLCYSAVKIFGFIAWQQNKKAQINA